MQKILGHSDANITAKVYAHLVPGFLENAVNRLPIGKTGSRALRDLDPLQKEALSTLRPDGV